MSDTLCNLCGLSCVLDRGKSTEDVGGLIGAVAVGGYASTPGNGEGALDDGTSYTFSLCEFCLDWLFSRFNVPVAVADDLHPNEKVEAWKPAAERVAQDDWREMKKNFAEEAERRAEARLMSGTIITI